MNHYFNINNINFPGRVINNNSVQSNKNSINQNNGRKKMNSINPENITVPPGKDYIEWKKIAKKFLMQRECELMNVRCKSVQSIIQNGIKEFENQNELILNIYNISNKLNEFKDQTLSDLYDKINDWKGVQINRVKNKSVYSFKKYYIVGKNWCDQNKKNVWDKSFWIKIFRLIHNFVHSNYNQKIKCSLLQQQLSDSLEFYILCKVFNGTVQFAQTKTQPLIPNGTIKQSKEIQNYLVKLNDTLTIHKWLEIQKKEQIEKDQKNNTKRKRTGNAKLIIIKLKQKLNEISDIKYQKYKNNISLSLYCENNAVCNHNHRNSINIMDINIDNQLYVKLNTNDNNDDNDDDDSTYDKFKGYIEFVDDDINEINIEFPKWDNNKKNTLNSLNTTNNNGGGQIVQNCVNKPLQIDSKQHIKEPVKSICPSSYNPYNPHNSDIDIRTVGNDTCSYISHNSYNSYNSDNTHSSNNSYNSYNGYHSISEHVQDYRYNPMGNYNKPTNCLNICCCSSYNNISPIYQPYDIYSNYNDHQNQTHSFI